MPDDRMLHRRQGMSAKLAQCDDLTYRVWVQYLLSADDFGVMVDEPAKIRGDNLRLIRESDVEIRRCLDTLLSLSLVLGFEHQGQRYLCSECWQDHQGIAYPRTSYLPNPTPEIFGKLSEKTQELFYKKSKAKDGDGHRHTLTANGLRLTANGSLHGGSHRAHASCGRVCVPAFLHAEFRTLVGGDEQAADAALRAHYRRWWDSISDETVVTEPIPWLRARFAETYAGQAAPVKPNKAVSRKATNEAFLKRHQKES